MTRKLTLSILLLLTVAPSLFGATSRYMVVWKKGSHVSAALSLAPEHRMRMFAHVGAFAADLTEEEAAALRDSRDVESVEPVIVVRALGLHAAPAPDAVFPEQVVPWGIGAIHARDVWAVTKGTSTVNVAVIDSGVDSKHPDLAHAYAGGANVIEPDAGPEDDQGHGTHVAGTIVAADNTFGVVGVAPGVRLWNVKVLDRGGNGTDESLVAGLEWVIAKKREIGGSWVANMSIGATGGTKASERAVQQALNAGIHMVAAAGNDGTAFLNYPAAYPGVISVGAVDSNLEVAEFSTYGTNLSVVAPGVEVTSAMLRGKIPEADVQLQQEVLRAQPVTGSPFKSVSGAYEFCGDGWPDEFPPSVSGKIAVIRRSPLNGPRERLDFRNKVKNAKDAGAIGVVLYNDDDTRGLTNWTMTVGDPPWPGYEFLLTVAISNAHAVKLLDRCCTTITAAQRYQEYSVLSGTSMATPHVTGTVALLLSLAPDANPAHIEWVLQRSAVDVHTDGWDERTSWGVIDAYAAAKLLAPQAFNLPTQPPPPPPRRRSARP